MTNIPPSTVKQATAADVAQASEEFARQRTKIANKKAQLVAFISTVIIGIIAVVALNVVGLSTLVVPKIYDHDFNADQYVTRISGKLSGKQTTPAKTVAPNSTRGGSVAPAPAKTASVAPVAPAAPAK